ncbi:MAG TPA: hypothetical protein VFJ90_11190 [Candidatus Didemnitutus sp.]|nr:hypothetical protein [Candidatus Didemnitutus sp.]
MKVRLVFFFAAVLLGLAGCNYDAPLTAKSTRKIDARLLGEWLQPEEKDWMIVRRLDDSTYVIAYGKDKSHDRPDLYRAFHSDFGGLAFISVQNLQPGSDDRKYSYLTCALSADGTRLTMRTVNNRVIPEQKTDTAGMQKLIEQNLKNPKLLNEEFVFVRPAPPQL